MIVFLVLIYVGVLFLLIKTGKVPNNKTTWLTVIPYVVLVMVGLFIPMQWGAPAGKATVMSYSVAIVPNVAGEVIEVPVKANVPVSKKDILFRIDPTPYQAALDALNAQLSLAKLRLGQAQQLVEHDAGSVFRVQSYQSQIDGLNAQIDAAEYNLNETTVRAPADGFVTNLTLRPGSRVASIPLSPSMAFIDSSVTDIVVQIHQIHTRYIEPGQKAEVTFKTIPGKVFPATVMYLVPVTSQGQAPVSGYAVKPMSTVAAPFLVRLKLDDQALAASLKPGAVADVAIYTSHSKAAHLIRQVMIRMTAIINYVNPT